MFAERIARSLGVLAICSQVIVTVAIVSLAPFSIEGSESPVSDTASVSWDPSDLPRQ